MTYSVNPLHPSQISNGPPVYNLDLHPETQRVLARRAVQTHPTAATTKGHPAWKWGRSVDRPSTSGAPQIFSPRMLEPQPTPEAAPEWPSLPGVGRRLRP
jgi:hypothetical protein